ncbi:FAD-dependent monooxygenase [Saccharothrix texasensis]|uniref:2-polyprenyl-6-methoxyphenol hydroxylase-like FAD-dependent oxidoreductase n=1 Tax=Saccharothrix texasensis TaxID=103734 RepID=A0A3N1GYR6_9PSEU|nr:FAD-dependent monooxygenase [Saccharothrix texasensis]ROP35424.1 2-polyprenyl-6-methoxyphenol hydroxylase-like FAD-dependent oxidoreductase [Saccharothrix texasensis]
MVGRTVVVVGGGIGGLAAAVALRRVGCRVVVLEHAAGFGEVGAGLALWPNAMRALAALGVAERVRAVGAVQAAGGVRGRSGRWLSRTDNAEIARRHGMPLVVVRRADLVRVLAEALPPECLPADAEVRAVRPDGDAVVVEHRGGVVRAELVVGADGVHSGVRRQWWPEAEPARYAGCTAWRMITGPVAEPPAEGAVIWGRGERFGFTGLPGGRFYCFGTAAVPAGGAAAEGEPAAVRARFGAWPDPVPALVAAVPEGGVVRHDVHVVPPLASYVRGRVALLGDAAHAMDPALGQGAGQALEDAVVLADCLVSAASVGSALVRYDRSRGPRTRAVARRSARLGRVARWTWPPAVVARDLAARLTPAAVALRAVAPVLGWNPPSSDRAPHGAGR